MVYEDEIPKELEVGKTYSSHELYHFVATNNDILVNSNEPDPFLNRGQQKFKVLESSDSYIHLGRDGFTYITPNIKTNLIFVSKI